MSCVPYWEINANNIGYCRYYDGLLCKKNMLCTHNGVYDFNPNIAEQLKRFDSLKEKIHSVVIQPKEESVV